MQYDYMGKNGFVWFHGVVEDTNDPLQIGRVRVRCLEFHSGSKQDIPTESLPWAVVLMPNTSPSMSGKGNSPSGLLQGSWVMGFFRDGIAAQDPVILGSFHGIPQPNQYTDKLRNPQYGFNDPFDVYPIDEYAEESDVNRLARNDDSLEYTVVPAKIDKSLQEVQTAMGETTWSQPPVSYDTVYPHNKVMETESGHVVEFDDTMGAERIHIRHTSGTWIEIYPDGSMVTKVAGEDNSIKLMSDNTLVNGDQNTNVNGSQRIRIGKDGLVEIVGDAKILVNGNTIMQTNKDFVHKVGGNYSVAADGNMLFVASRIDFNPEGVGSDSLGVDLPSSEETVAELEIITGKTGGSSYQVKAETEETAAGVGGLGGAVGGVAGAAAGEAAGAAAAAETAVSEAAPPELLAAPTEAATTAQNFVEQPLSSSVGGVSQPTNFVETAVSPQLQSTGTEVVNSSGTTLQNIPVQTTQTASKSSLLGSMGGIVTTTAIVGGVAAVGVVTAMAASRSSSRQYPTPISPVSVPAGSQPVQTNAPGLPTQSFYAIPGATATYIAGYPGLSGAALSNQNSTIGQVNSIPAVPLVGFETEFPTQGVEVLDGGDF